MQLKSVQICNFRSVKNQTIHFKNNCMILVGRNEAGKSNILKAVAGGLSQDAYQFSAKDKRKILPSEDRPNEDEYYVRYHYTFAKEEMEDIIQTIARDDLESAIMKSGKPFSLHDYFYEFFSDIMYEFNLDKNKAIINFLKTDKAPDEFDLLRPLFVVQNPVTINSVDYKLNEIVDHEFETEDLNLQEIDSSMLYQNIADKVVSFFKSNLPKVVYWKYSDTYLLPDNLSINTFRSSPNSSIPLRNIFELAGYKDIEKAFSDAKARDGDFSNLFDRVSEIATKQFILKWPDLCDTKIILISDGDLLRVKIQERAKYNFSERSDGFKRFISILIMLSTQVETGKISNNIIIIDEPDNSLYPSGSRYLRDELIKIAEKNIVLYSTHSPFMIDRDNISRHIVVTKKEDITSVKETKMSKYSEDEVLLNALGTSIFESLKFNNILFEGWSDYRIFNVAISSKKTSYKVMINGLKDLGKAYVHGVQSFKLITPIIQLANKNIFIFSDSDNSAISARTSYKRDKGYQMENWYTIEDLGGSKNHTIEDYLTNEFLQQGIDATLGEGRKNISEKSTVPVMEFLCDLSKEQKEKVKQYYSENVTVGDINPIYYNLLNNLLEKVQTFTP